jgi:diguanylate cyclase (GGDEF)-like protein
LRSSCWSWFCAALPERDEARATLELAKTHDPLTRLPNRSLFVRRLDEVLASGGTGAVLILDIERLPLINDVLGHDAGDEILVEVADRLRRSVRADDLVARLSGGELVVLLQTSPDVEILAIAERLLELCRVTRDSPQGQLDVMARVGMVQWDDTSRAAPGAELLRAAERAMHADEPPPAHPPTSPTAPTTSLATCGATSGATSVATPAASSSPNSAQASPNGRAQPPRRAPMPAAG